jgi:hypothetical protein
VSRRHTQDLRALYAPPPLTQNSSAFYVLVTASIVQATVYHTSHVTVIRRTAAICPRYSQPPSCIVSSFLRQYPVTFGRVLPSSRVMLHYSRMFNCFFSLSPTLQWTHTVSIIITVGFRNFAKAPITVSAQERVPHREHTITATRV